MKTFVVDSSVTLKWVLKDEIDAKPAKIILDTYNAGNIDLIAPNLWLYEVTNVLKNVSLTKKTTSHSMIMKKLLNLLNFSPSLIDIFVLAPFCLKNAFKFNISVYDSSYVTLAQSKSLQLITADNKLVKKIDDPDLAISLKKFKIQ